MLAKASGKLTQRRLQAEPLHHCRTERGYGAPQLTHRALRQLAARFRKQQSAAVGLRISPGVAGLSLEAQEVIYRVAKEALQNAFKHSQASSVKLLMGSADKRIRLSIQDDGVGFSTETAQGKPLSFGLADMRERATLLGGTLVLKSAPGKGATVILELPRTSAKGVR